MKPHIYNSHLIFDKGNKTILWDTKTVFSTNGAGSTVGQHVEECKQIHSSLVLQADQGSPQIH
jgi:hypothetical protein